MLYKVIIKILIEQLSDYEIATETISDLAESIEGAIMKDFKITP